MSNIKYLLFTALISMLLSISISAQDLQKEFEDFQEQVSSDFDEELKKQNDEYQQFLLIQNQNFINFITKGQEELIALLQQDWIEIRNTDFKQNSLSPKPISEVKYKDTVNSFGFSVYNSYPVDSLTTDLKQHYFNEENIHYKETNFTFFGAEVKINYPENLDSLQEPLISSDGITEYYQTVTSIGISKTLTDLLKYKSNHNLNDWGLYLLCLELSEKIFPNNSNLSHLFCWYSMNRLGYDFKIGIDGMNLHLAAAINSKVYNKSFISLNSRDYYILSGSSKSFRTYPSSILNGRPMTLKIERPLSLPTNNIKIKKVSMEYKGRSYHFDFPANLNNIAFYKNYPTCEPNIHVNTPLSPGLKSYIKSEVAPIISNLTLRNQLEFLYKLTQSLYSYSTDSLEFGKEKIFFPEESFYYMKSDCEDRTILLSYLAKELLNLSSIALDFDGHLIVGINLPYKLDNASNINYNNVIYTLIDPSYSKAPIGIIQPELNDKIPTIYKLHTTKKRSINIDRIYKNCLVEDVYTNLAGDSFFAVIVINDFSFADTIIKAGNQFAKATLLTISRDGTEKVVLEPEAQSDAYFHSMNINKRNEIFLFGSYRDSLMISGQQLKSSSGSHFILKLEPDYSLAWLKEINPTALDDSIQYYSCVYSENGDVQYFGSQIETTVTDNFRLEFDTYGNCIVNGSRYYNGTVNIESVMFESGDEFEIIDWLVRENSRLINTNVNALISPVLAAARLVTSSNITLTGNTLKKAVESAFNQTNIGQKMSLNSLNEISTISNQLGYVTIQTKNNKAVQIQNLSVDNNSKLKYADYEDISRLVIYSGIQFHNNLNHYKINNILIEKSSGEVLYDYDNHYKAKLPSRNIIL